jgi:hypothetical protein
VRLLHALAKTIVLFDGPHLVSHAGLAPVMALAERAGLGEPAGEGRPGVPRGTGAPGAAAARRGDPLRSSTGFLCRAQLAARRGNRVRQAREVTVTLSPNMDGWSGAQAEGHKIACLPKTLCVRYVHVADTVT